MKKSRIRVALAGNPNSGKTTLFNALTGARQHVGNYPGVTVEKKEGQCTHNEQVMTITDLPGTYSLTAHSAEELAARHFLVEEKPDVVVNILDASNLERNLYLSVQLMELGVPLVLVLNMSDVAESRGIRIDAEKMAVELGVPVLKMVAQKKQGVPELLDAVVRVAGESVSQLVREVRYGKELEKSIARVAETLTDEMAAKAGGRPRWVALKLLELDEEVAAKVAVAEVQARVQSEADRLLTLRGDDADILIADARYGYISGVGQSCVRASVEQRHTMSDQIDRVVTSRVLGIPIFLGLMYVVFYLTFTLGAPPMDWIDAGFSWLGDAIRSLWPAGSESLLLSLLVDGVIAGVGGVLIFLPNILMLFLAIAILEDSGYMARAAFLMDRLMHKIGLHGKSFIPLLIGFGCSVPAIMATRTLENRRDRLTTMLVVPLASCGARLPIYTLIIPAFFPKMWQAPILWLMYVIGIVLAIVCAKLLRSTFFKGETVPFVMELPPYRMPTVKGTLIHMWERGGLYVKKAGTVILGISIVLWALTTFPQTEASPDLSPDEQQAAELSHTIAGRIGHGLEPVLKPMGFDWRIGTALIGAFAAKEVFVAQLGIVYSVGEADEESEPLRAKLQERYTPLIGFCIMLFCLISAPCMATIAVTRRESNSWFWALFQLGGLTLLAYVLTVTVYQSGRLLGW